MTTAGGGMQPDVLSAGDAEGRPRTRRLVAVVAAAAAVLAFLTFRAVGDSDQPSVQPTAPALATPTASPVRLGPGLSYGSRDGGAFGRVSLQFDVVNESPTPVSLRDATLAAPYLTPFAPLRPDGVIAPGQTVFVDALVQVDCSRLGALEGPIFLDHRDPAGSAALSRHRVGDLSNFTEAILSACGLNIEMSLGVDVLAATPEAVRLRVRVDNAGATEFGLFGVEVEGYGVRPSTQLPVVVPPGTRGTVTVDVTRSCSDLSSFALVVRLRSARLESSRGLQDDAAVTPALRRLKRGSCGPSP